MRVEFEGILSHYVICIISCLIISEFCGVRISGKDIARGGGTESMCGWQWEGSFAVIGHHEDRVQCRRIVWVCGWNRRRRFVGRHGFDLIAWSCCCFVLAGLLLTLRVDGLSG